MTPQIDICSSLLKIENASHDIAEKLKKEFPQFRPERAAFNLHGIGIFGYDNQKSHYALFWIHPCEQTPLQICCSEIFRDQFFGSSFASSEDKLFEFKYFFETREYFLNGMKAQRIMLY